MPGQTNEDLRKLIGDLPDSRPHDQRGQIRTPAGLATPVFCINCGGQFGFAFVDTAAIIYVCDECEGRHGGLPLPVVDEDYVRARNKEEG